MDKYQEGKIKFLPDIFNIMPFIKSQVAGGEKALILRYA
jgi:hypothetical protein